MATYKIPLCEAYVPLPEQDAVLTVEAESPGEAVYKIIEEQLSKINLGFLVRQGDQWHRIEVSLVTRGVVLEEELKL